MRHDHSSLRSKARIVGNPETIQAAFRKIVGLPPGFVCGLRRLVFFLTPRDKIKVAVKSAFALWQLNEVKRSREAAEESSPQPALSLPKGRKAWVRGIPR